MIDKSLIIQCYNSCPCICPGCYNFFSAGQISCEDIDRFVSEYQERFGLFKVTLSGGDPLLREDLAVLIDKICNKNISITIDTVGSVFLNNIDKKLLSSLNKISFLGLPIDGVNDETIQHFRQKSTFEQCVRIVERSQRIVPAICVNTVVHSKNLNEILEIATVVNNYPSILKWQLFQFMPIGPGGFANKSQYSIDNTEFEELERTLKGMEFRDSLRVECKSIENRRNKYLILGSDGVLWLPQMSPDRKIVGSVFENDIFDRLMCLNDEDI